MIDLVNFVERNDGQHAGAHGHFLLIVPHFKLSFFTESPVAIKTCFADVIVRENVSLTPPISPLILNNTST